MNKVIKVEVNRKPVLRRLNITGDPNLDNDKWHRRYLQLAQHISQWSKDPSSKIGAVCVGTDGQILSTGYNGFPRNILDLEERYNDRPTKYQYVIHAEMNCIYNASLNGLSLKGSTLYAWGLPICSECSKGIVQSGIKTVVIEDKGEVPEKWAASWELASSILIEAGVQIHMVKLEHIPEPELEIRILNNRIHELESQLFGGNVK